jgi:peptide chain release factor 1
LLGPVDDLGVDHLVVEVVALTGTLAHAGEHRQTAVRLGDVVDQFHHVHGLADAGAAEQADLAALGERADQVDDLDAGFQQLGGRGPARRRTGRAVDDPLVGGRSGRLRRSGCPARP